MSREQLLTFDMLKRHPLVTDQVAYKFRWDQVDALYEFVCRLPAWIVDDDIMDIWKSGEEDDPRSFKGWEAKKAEWGQVLLISWAPLWMSDGAASQTVKVFTAVIVCIHPCQAVMSIKDGASDLLNHSMATLMRSMSALCQLPKPSVGTFYPSPLNHSYLVLPYLHVKGEEKKVHLDLSVAFNQHMVVRHLHWCQGVGGDEAVLPPIYLQDPGIPGMLAVGYLGPMWKNTQYTSAVPTGGTGLQGAWPAISEVTFCADEVNAHRSLAPMGGEGVVYPPKYYDKSGKLLKISRHKDDDEPPEPKDCPAKEVMQPPLPTPSETAGGGSDKEDDAKSKEASSSDSDSSSNSDSEDSSQDSPSSKSSNDRSDAQSDVSKHKIRRKKKPHQSSKAESDGEPIPEDTKTSVDPEDAKEAPHDSGIGDGATASPTAGSSGDGVATLLGIHSTFGGSGRGSLPLPTTLPSMATLEALINDLEKFSERMFKSLEETNIAVYDKVLRGFKDTSGKCKTFIHEMGALVVTFFAQAKKMEDGLVKCDARAFEEAIDASKNHIIGLMEEVTEAEDIYDRGEAHFNSILASVAKEIKEYVKLKGEEQRQEYKKKCLDQIKQDHGRLDSMCFIPMIVGNLTAHHALTMSQWVAQSHVPLKIMIVPLHTQVGAIKVYMKFMEFLARQVVALQERLGPGAVGIPLESEPNDQSSTKRGRSHLASPTRQSPTPSRHGSPARTDPTEKAPTAAEVVFSPHSQNALNLWKQLDLSDGEVEDTFSDEEKEGKCQAPLPTPNKHPHDGSDDKKSPSKKAKVDVSDLYGAATKVDKGKGNSTPSDIKKSKTSKPKKAKKDKKKKNKKNKKDKKEKSDKKESNKKAEKSTKDKTPEKKAELKMPEKTRRNVSDGKDSETTATPKSKKKIRAVQECRKDKWASDLPEIISYCQRVGIFTQNLPEGHNYTDHTDYIRQLMCHKTIGLNIMQLDDQIAEFQGLTSSHHIGRLASLKEWKGKQMGNSGVNPQYVVKAFLEPATQWKISAQHANHWHSDLMIGLYSVHRYDAISKENVRRVDGAKPTALGYCPMCSYATGNHPSINNHIRAHYHLLLECGYSWCVYVEADCYKMYEHGIKKHNHTKAAEAADNA